MTGVYRAPITPGQQWADDNGAPLALGTLQTLLAGTLTPQATFTGADGAVANATTIVFDADGRLPSGADVWFSGGVAYRFIIKRADGVTIDDKDNLTGVNDPAFASSGFGEWIAGPEPTFIAASPPQFSVIGDQRSLFQVARRVRLTDNAVLLTATVRAASFAAGVTTVTLVMDDGAALSNQLSAVEYALLAAEPRSGPMPHVVALSDGDHTLQFSGAPHTIYRSGALAAPRVYTLPPVAPEGAVLDFYNEDSADAITLNASGGGAGAGLAAGAWMRLVVVAADGDTSSVADWRKIDGSDVVVVLTSGTSWAPPLGVYRVWAEVYGGGGGGAGCAANLTGCGGGAGGLAKGFQAVTPGSAVSYSIGAGGAGGAAGGNNGSDASASTFGGFTGGGGVKGLTASNGAGLGGGSSGGVINLLGGPGHGAAGDFAASNGGSNDRAVGGLAIANSDGLSGSVFGGGGAGGQGIAGSARAGGAGGPGRVLLIY